MVSLVPLDRESTHWQESRRRPHLGEVRYDSCWRSCQVPTEDGSMSDSLRFFFGFLKTSGLTRKRTDAIVTESSDEEPTAEFFRFFAFCEVTPCELLLL